MAPVLALVALVIAPQAQAATIMVLPDVYYYWLMPVYNGSHTIVSWEPWITETFHDMDSPQKITVPSFKQLQGVNGQWGAWPNSAGWGGPNHNSFSGHGDFTYVGYRVPSTFNDPIKAQGNTGAFPVTVPSPDAGKVIAPGGTITTPAYGQTTCSGDDIAHCAVDVTMGMAPVYMRGIRFDGNGATSGSVDLDMPSTPADRSGDWWYTFRKSPYKRDGYIFVGWNTDRNGNGTWYMPGQKVNMGKPMTVEELKTTGTSSLAVYAQWSRNPITVRYDANGGSGSMDSMTVNPGIPFTIADNKFTYKHHTFVSWNTKPDGTGETIKPGQSHSFGNNTTLYAQWDATEYSVKFDGNARDATGSMQDQLFEFDVEQALTANAFKREGWTFTGWNTKPDGTGVSYTDGQVVRNLAGSDGATVTLYAQWKHAPVNLHFDANKGDGSHDPIKGLAFEAIQVPSDVDEAFTRDGYLLIGWNTKPEGTGETYHEGDKITMGAADATLYAVWTPAIVTMPPTGGHGWTIPALSLWVAVGGSLSILMAVFLILRHSGRLAKICLTVRLRSAKARHGRISVVHEHECPLSDLG